MFQYQVFMRQSVVAFVCYAPSLVNTFIAGKILLYTGKILLCCWINGCNKTYTKGSINKQFGHPKLYGMLRIWASDGASAIFLKTVYVNLKDIDKNMFNSIWPILFKIAMAVIVNQRNSDFKYNPDIVINNWAFNLSIGATVGVGVITTLLSCVAQKASKPFYLLTSKKTLQQMSKTDTLTSVDTVDNDRWDKPWVHRPQLDCWLGPW